MTYQTVVYFTAVVKWLLLVIPVLILIYQLSAGDDLSVLFSEELGAVIQIVKADVEAVNAILAKHGILDCCTDIGRINNEDYIRFSRDGAVVLENSRTYYRTLWAQTTYKMQSLRDNPECAQQEHDVKFDTEDPGLNAQLSFDINEDIVADLIVKDGKMQATPKLPFYVNKGLTRMLKWLQPLTVQALPRLMCICLIF